MTDETFGQRLRRLRLARDLRVLDVAYAARITEGAIRQMEGGQTKGASLVVGLRIAKLLGVTPQYLATGTEGRADDVGALRVVLDRLDDHERRIAEVERRLGISYVLARSGLPSRCSAASSASTCSLVFALTWARFALKRSNTATASA